MSSLIAERRRQAPIRRGARPVTILLGAAALGLAALMAGHSLIPDVAGIGLLVDSILPWLGLGAIVLAALAVVVGGRHVWLAIAVPVIVWLVMFVPSVLPLESTVTPSDTLTVASQNVEEGSGTGAESALALAESGADVIALQEMDSTTRDAVAASLGDRYPYSYAIGTVGLWSVHPIVNSQPLDLGLGWNRALAADLDTPSGLVSIYVVHAASARPDELTDRDTMLAQLADTLPNDENARAVVVGDFNASPFDRAFRPVEDLVSEPLQSDGGFGFTWPAEFPVTRPDHVLVKGMPVTANTTLRAGASDHLALLTTMGLE
jgi:vancomycin resistance protein VanJ